MLTSPPLLYHCVQWIILPTLPSQYFSHSWRLSGIGAQVITRLLQQRASPPCIHSAPPHAFLYDWLTALCKNKCHLPSPRTSEHSEGGKGPSWTREATDKQSYSSESYTPQVPVKASITLLDTLLELGIPSSNSSTDCCYFANE